MEKNWFYVIFGGFLEIFWVLCLKKSENFHHFWYFISERKCICAKNIVFCIISYRNFGSKNHNKGGIICGYTLSYTSRNSRDHNGLFS